MDFIRRSIKEKWMLALLLSSFLLAPLTVFAGQVNINKASAEEMAEQLNGVGESKAMAIVKYRNANGAFKSPADIVNVDGIGEATFEKNRALIVVK